MYRREMLRYFASLGVCSLQPVQSVLAETGMSEPAVSISDSDKEYSGRFFVTLQASGAWDVASFCDPKVNQTGQKIINRWSMDGGIATAGNIAYASYAHNAAFFSKYYKDMLVINGVDAQTNSHSTGVIHNWSGRNSAGYPSLTALFSAIHGSDLPLSYINYGGYAETAKLTRYSKVQDLDSLLAILTPNVRPWNNRQLVFKNTNALARIQNFQNIKLESLLDNDKLLTQHRYTMEAYQRSRRVNAGLSRFADAILSVSEREPDVVLSTGVRSQLLGQIQATLLAFKSGVGCSADLSLGGFDTHDTHDERHEPLLGHFTDAIDYFWSYADDIGIADRITLLIASDFGRTPFYNNTNGKDHWPIGSAIVMEKNAPWANSVIGSTTENLRARQVLPESLQAVDTNGSIVYPAHVHTALRKYLGLASPEIQERFPLDVDTELNFFA